MTIAFAVVGAGRMGSIVIQQVPEDTKKLVIDLDKEKAQEIALKIKGTAYTSLEAAKEADIIAVVLPTSVVNDTLEELLKIVKPGTIILNMATTAHIKPEVIENSKKVRVVDTKIIGHASSISRGESSILVVKTDDDKLFSTIKSQLIGFKNIVQGNADLVEKINVIGSTEGIRAAVRVSKQLREMQVPEEWINVVIKTVCAGTMKSFTEDDLGHFGKELAKQLEREE